VAQVALQSITKRFGEVVAIKDLTVTVRDREFLVLLGPSGAGKTTTLRTVAGLEKPDVGSVRIGGVEVNRLTPAQRNVAFVFQDYALYPFMTAYQNMAFPLKAPAQGGHRLSTAEIDKRVRAVAAVLQIEHLLGRKPAQLSGGEQQRVALGRAMVRRPQAFLMDEPLTNLDAKLRTLMRAELKHLHGEIGATTLYVTHDQVEALTMGDRIAVLRAGTCQQIGTPDEIYHQPANTFVAGFVGNPSMNLLAGRLASRASGGPDRGGVAVELDNDAGRVPLPGALASVAATAPAAEVVLGVRAEDIHIVPQTEPGVLPATVYAVEPLGDRYIYDLQVGRYVVKVKASPAQVLEAGQPVGITFDPDHLHLFDAATQNRLTGPPAAAGVPTRSASGDRRSAFGPALAHRQTPNAERHTPKSGSPTHG
jgi:multiple sugar transport system ATP-binding protein